MNLPLRNLAWTLSTVFGWTIRQLEDVQRNAGGVGDRSELVRRPDAAGKRGVRHRRIVVSGRFESLFQPAWRGMQFNFIGNEGDRLRETLYGDDANNVNVFNRANIAPCPRRLGTPFMPPSPLSCLMPPVPFVLSSRRIKMRASGMPCEWLLRKCGQ